MLVEKKYYYPGGNMVHLAAKENKQHFHLNQNSRVLTVKESLD